MKKVYLIYCGLFLLALFVSAIIIGRVANNESYIVTNNLESITQSENTYTHKDLKCKGNKSTRCVIGCTCGLYYTTGQPEGGDIEESGFHCYGCGDIVGW